MLELDDLDKKAAAAFEGHLVRKDLVRRFRGQFPVPTYVVEFLLGPLLRQHRPARSRRAWRWCSSSHRPNVRAGEEELFKAEARARTGRSRSSTSSRPARRQERQLSRQAAEPAAQRRSHRRPAGARPRADADRRLLRRGGRSATTPASPRKRAGARSRSERCAKSRCRPATSSTRSPRRERAFTTEEWKDCCCAASGLSRPMLTPRARDVSLLRMVPFVERNYNLVELGPRGTGKSHLFQQVSPYAHLVSGGKATVARMFVNMATGQRGLVCQYDVVCFDEVSGVSFDQKDGVNIMKGYMESGEFSRGRESIRADGSIVMVGNFDVDVEHQQRVGHLFGPAAAGDAQRHGLHGPHPRLSARLGHPEGQQDAVHGPLRAGQRLPGRVLLAAAVPEPCRRDAGPSPSRRGAVRPRHERRQQDRIRVAQAALPGCRDSRCRDEDLEWAVRLALKCGGGSRSSRSGSVPRSSAIRTSATPWDSMAWKSSSRRPSCRARTASAPIRCRPARSGPSAPAARTRRSGCSVSR